MIFGPLAETEKQTPKPTREKMIDEIRMKDIFYRLVDFKGHSTSQIGNIYKRTMEKVKPKEGIFA